MAQAKTVKVAKGKSGKAAPLRAAKAKPVAKKAQTPAKMLEKSKTALKKETVKAVTKVAKPITVVEAPIEKAAVVEKPVAKAAKPPKAPKPPKPPKAPSAKQEKINEANLQLSQKWAALNRKAETIESKPYNMKSVYEEKTAITHKVLGWGYILANRNDRLEVLFKDGIKYLISNYKSA